MRGMDAAEYVQIVDYLQIAERSKYSERDVKARFETEPAASYGENMARWIPDFEYAHQLFLDSLAVYLPEQATGVELGAGSGRVSRMLLDTFPQLQLTLVDLSPNMLAAAAQRLAPYGDRCQVVVHDIFDAGLNFPPSSLDGVVSVFAICHARGSDVYERLYRRIHDWLKPGGCFVCYDHVLGDSRPLSALNALGWHRLLRASQTAEEAKEGIVSTYQEDSPLSLRQHLVWLAAAGFSVADVLYKRDIFAIYLGVK
jgi:tRNA (cmo5U34)-methyltransferase